MSEYLLLANPGHSRVYLDSAAGAALCELRLLVPEAEAEPSAICGQTAFLLRTESPLTEEQTAALARSSLFFALFERAEGGLLRPLDVPAWQYLPEKLNSILKYQGKTNEQFTRLLVNFALQASERTRPVPTLLDPMCGQGTTLFEAAIRGWNAVGLEVQEQPVTRGAQYFVRFLETERYKHKRAEEKRSHGGKRIGRVVTVTYADTKDHWYGDDTRSIRFFRGDSADAKLLLPPGNADLLACDLPYGVQHGASGAGGLQRNAASLVRQCAPGWFASLRPGAGAALAYNTFTTPRAQLAAAMESAGFAVLPQAEGLEHRVDQSILRDVLTARKPK